MKFNIKHFIIIAAIACTPQILRGAEAPPMEITKASDETFIAEMQNLVRTYEEIQTFQALPTYQQYQQSRQGGDFGILITKLEVLKRSLQMLFSKSDENLATEFSQLSIHLEQQR